MAPLVLPPMVAAATLEEAGFFYVRGLYVWGEIEMGNVRRGGQLMRRFRRTQGRFDCKFATMVRFLFRGLRKEESTGLFRGGGWLQRRRCARYDAGEKGAMGQPVVGPTAGNRRQTWLVWTVVGPTCTSC
jgi:hypothetical protein